MRVAALLLMVALTQGATSKAQDVDRLDRAGADAPQAADSKAKGETPGLGINAGYLFLNGIYMEPPYRFKFSNADVSINEATIDISVYNAWKNEKRLKNGVSRSHSQQIHRQLKLLFETDGRLVVFEGEPFQAFHRNESYDLLNVLVDAEARQAFKDGERDWLPSGVDETAWGIWISEFECPEELAERAGEMLTRIEQIDRTNASQISARRTLESSA